MAHPAQPLPHMRQHRRLADEDQDHRHHQHHHHDGSHNHRAREAEIADAGHQQRHTDDAAKAGAVQRRG
jgi:hypothetical protein